MNHPAISTGVLPTDLWWLAPDDTHPPFRPAVRENDVCPDDQNTRLTEGKVGIVAAE
jgi:hypothetical protein